MKILIVNETYPFTSTVSSFRIKAFREYFIKKDIKVKIATSYKGNEKLEDYLVPIPAEYIRSTLSTVRNIFKIKNILKKDIKDSDFIIISTPHFNLALLIFIIKNKSKVILDLRDLPDLYLAQKKKIYKGFKYLLHWTMYKITELYVLLLAKKVRLVTTVGETSRQCFLSKYKFLKPPLTLNIHNGFEINDLEIIKRIEKAKNESIDKICIVGSLYSFRYSKYLEKLNDYLSKTKDVVCHFGKVEKMFADFFNRDNIKYESMKLLPRKELLVEMSKYKMFVLITSDNIIWEPTTTVFDYVLFNKPILFIGNKNNEAHKILVNNKAKIIYPEDIIENVSGNDSSSVFNNNINMDYSRERNVEILYNYLINNY